MKIFISWSGLKSKQIASIFNEWIPNVLQFAQPFMSAQNIEKGERWSQIIGSELQNSNFGILVLTKDNFNSPWILFEAGALSKVISNSCVCPFLFDVKNSDLVASPLIQFQTTQFNKEDIHKLVKSINRSSAINLQDQIINNAFVKWWPDLQHKLKEIQEIDFDQSSFIGKVSIALPEKEIDAKNYSRILNATKEFMYALGLKLDYEEPPKLGSFFQKLIFNFAKKQTHNEIKEIYSKGLKALELSYKDESTNEISENLKKAADNFIASMSDINEAAIILGSIIFIKIDMNQENLIIVEKLDSELIRIIQETPKIMNDPNELYNLLVNERKATGKEIAVYNRSAK